MIFQEKKVEDAWEYKVEDVFGVIVINSDAQLDASILDDMVVLLLRQNLNAETVNGSVQHDNGTVKYTFTKEPQWGDVSPEEESEWDDPNDNLCENTPISTKETVSVFTPIILYVGRIFKKLQRSAEVLRNIWKNPQ